jgi:hypothetical protein
VSRLATRGNTNLELTTCPMSPSVTYPCRRLGLSRREHSRRRRPQEAVTAPQPVTVKDLRAFGKTFADLVEPAVMKGAWD